MEHRITIADDESDVRGALRRLFKLAGVDTQSYASAEEFLEAPSGRSCDCLILDHGLPGMSGLELQSRLAASDRRLPIIFVSARDDAEADIDLPVIFITGHGDIPMTVRALKAGALELLTKPLNEQQLLDAMQRGIDKHRRQLMRRAQMMELQTRYRSLTNRERQVFSLVANGYLHKQIAAELGTSEKTVEIHRGQVMVKMKADSVPDLVHMASMLGLSSSRDTAA